MLRLLNLQVLAWGESSAHRSGPFAYLSHSGLSLGERAWITEGMKFAKAPNRDHRPSLEEGRSLVGRVILVR